MAFNEKSVRKDGSFQAALRRFSNFTYVAKEGRGGLRRQAPWRTQELFTKVFVVNSVLDYRVILL